MTVTVCAVCHALQSAGPGEHVGSGGAGGVAEPAEPETPSMPTITTATTTASRRARAAQPRTGGAGRRQGRRSLPNSALTSPPRLVGFVHFKLLHVAETVNRAHTPHADFNGSDSFTYKVTDDGGPDSNVSTVLITVVRERGRARTDRERRAKPPAANPHGSGTQGAERTRPTDEQVVLHKGSYARP